jgi:hypothetical protein
MINTPVPINSLTTSSPSSTLSPSSGSRGSSNIGTVAGGVVGGVVAICAAAFIAFFFLRMRRKRRHGSPTVAVLDPIPHPQSVMDEFRPQSSDARPFVLPSLPETRASPMRLYVRVSTCCSRVCVALCTFLMISLFYMRRTRMTQPRSPGIKEPMLCQRPTP